MNCFGRSGSCCSNCCFTLWDSPKIGNHGDTTLMNMHHCRIFICISKILGYIFRHQFCLPQVSHVTIWKLPPQVPTISNCLESAKGEQSRQSKRQTVKVPCKYERKRRD